MFSWVSRLLKRDLNVGQLRQLIYGPPTIAGVSISEEMALGLTAVYRAVDLISSTVASLDADVFRTLPGKGRQSQPRHRVSLLMRDPNDDQNKFVSLQPNSVELVVRGRAITLGRRGDITLGSAS